jgi:Holliday junction resolvase RusA-like endonuclease
VTVTIRVPGVPQPQGSKTKTRWGGMRDANSERLTPWRNAISIATVQTVGHRWQPLDGPLSVSVVFTMPKPTSAPKRRRTWPAKKPDIDKLIRACFDGITDGGLWRDDALVVDVYARKVYTGDPDASPAPGALIHVRPVEQEAS